MTEEDEEFQRLEREVEMRRMVVRRIVEEDDDIQDYKKPWVGLTDEERESIANATIRIHGQEWAYATAIEARLKEKNT
jgi:hypothetical protein